MDVFVVRDVGVRAVRARVHVGAFCVACGVRGAELEDLSVWCYSCKSYVTHEVLERYREHAEALKFRGAGSSA